MAVVTVNQVQITQEDVDRAQEKLLLELEGQIPPEQMDQARSQMKKQAVESLVNQSLLLQEADRKGIQPDEKQVEDRFRDIAGRFPQVEDFHKVLDSMGFSEETFRVELARNQKIETLLQGEVGTPEKATEGDVDAFYRDYPDNFTLQEKVRASHILISAGPEDPEPVRVQKRLELSKLRGELEQGGDFASLASQHSGCPSKAQGGDLGFFERGKMVKPFDEAAFNLKPGEISDIVETKFGCHLILATERQEAGIVPLEEVRDKVAEFLNGQKNQEKIGAYLGTLRQAATIEYAGGTQA